MDAAPQPATNSTPSPFDEDVLVPAKPLVNDARFNVTAMVDLVFMMNIFFLVTWAAAARAEIELPTARHCSKADSEDSVVLTILKGPQVFLGSSSAGAALSAGEVDQRVTAYVEAAVRESRTIVLIKVEREVPLRDVSHVGAVATAVKGTKLMLAVIEKK